MAELMTSLNVYQRINKVREEVAYLQKDKQVGSGGWGYKAVTHDAVTAAVRPSLIKHGIIVVPCVVQSTIAPTGTTTGKGVPYIRYEARYEVHFVNADAPEERITVVLDAHALDDADKAPGKATSYATKYAFLKLLSIETGEDEEAREPQKPQKPEPSSKGDGTTRPAKNSLDAPKVGMDDLTAEQIDETVKVASKVMAWLEADSLGDAVMERNNAALSAEQAVFFWTFFDSKQRAAMKAEHERIKLKYQDKEPA